MNQCTTKNYQLPNGKIIQHLNNYETDFVFNEIFINETYLKSGIKIKENAVIFDIGANIGLFSLYVKQKYPNSTIYAFEPAPEVYQILKNNMASLDRIKTFNFALSDKVKEGIFYYYPEFSVISGFHAHPERDAEIIMSGIEDDDTKINIEPLIKQRLKKVISMPCQLTSISKIIQQQHIKEIDLIKLDAEGSELAILKGIEDQDWLKINQIAMEIHNQNDLNIINTLLKNKSFDIVIEPDKRLKNAGIYNLFAIKNFKK